VRCVSVRCVSGSSYYREREERELRAEVIRLRQAQLRKEIAELSAGLSASPPSGGRHAEQQEKRQKTRGDQGQQKYKDLDSEGSGDEGEREEGKVAADPSQWAGSSEGHTRRQTSGQCREFCQCPDDGQWCRFRHTSPPSTGGEQQRITRCSPCGELARWSPMRRLDLWR
jgi:hypothetical protein